MKFQKQIGEKILEVEINDFAFFASGASFVKYGGTLILSTAQLGENKEDLGFFPLTCDFEEKYYAAGKIGGSRFIRREGRPSTEAVLTSRMIDRAIRPLFPKGLKNEIQVIATCLSWDEKNDPATLGLIGSSLSLLISPIPWLGPVGAIRIGRVDGKLILYPNYEEREKGELDLVLVGTERGGEILINMVECGAKEVSEKEFVKAFDFSLPYLKEIIDFQKEIASKLAKAKMALPSSSDDAKMKKEAKKFLSKRLEQVLFEKDEKESGEKLKNLMEEFKEKMKDDFGDEGAKKAAAFFEEEKEEIIDENILKEEKRIDGRKLDQVREISGMVGILPRTHGSGFFSRGLTKILSILTLGAPGDHLLLEGMEISGEKRFLHHYNFPPYSVGEVRRLSGPGRRELGHGALAEKALTPLIPSFIEFPYTIRIVSEALSSSGSTSMASVCAASLALMDAGVPLKRPAAGIAIGLIKKSNKEWKILTDIQGPEDSCGDMDFKVAGTEEGITAIQLDVKVDGLNKEIFAAALERAKKARLEILEKMKQIIPCSRQDLSPFAPRVLILNINPAKIGLVIGSGGSTIRQITEDFEVEVDVEEDGRVFITSQEKEGAEKAFNFIKNLVKDIEPGDFFRGKVKRILDFGAMIEIAPGKDGLCHISEFSSKRINKVSDVVKVGDIIPVKVVNIDELGRVNLSAKEAGFENSSAKKKT